MTSESGNDSESSLPTHAAQLLPSSPPVIPQSPVSFEQLENMHSPPQVKPEPPATQVDEATKPPLGRVNSEETERPPSAQQVHRDSDEHADEDEDDEEELDSDPAEKIADFDWNALHERYHQVMDGCHDAEGELAQEWESLMNVQLHISSILPMLTSLKYFRIWAESGHAHETDRTFQRYVLP
jgi:hypothetical protein